MQLTAIIEDINLIVMLNVDDFVVIRYEGSNYLPLSGFNIIYYISQYLND